MSVLMITVCPNTHTHTHTDRQTDRHTHTDTHTQTDIHTHTHTHTHTAVWSTIITCSSVAGLQVWSPAGGIRGASCYVVVVGKEKA